MPSVVVVSTIYPSSANLPRSSFHLLRRLGGERLANSLDLDLPSMNDSMRLRSVGRFAPPRSALAVLIKIRFLSMILVIPGLRKHLQFIWVHHDVEIHPARHVVDCISAIRWTSLLSQYQIRASPGGVAGVTRSGNVGRREGCPSSGRENRGAKEPGMVATFGGLAAVLDIQEMSQGQACGLFLSRPVVMIDQNQRFGPRGF